MENTATFYPSGFQIDTDLELLTSSILRTIEGPTSITPVRLTYSHEGDNNDNVTNNLKNITFIQSQFSI